MFLNECFKRQRDVKWLIDPLPGAPVEFTGALVEFTVELAVVGGEVGA